MTAETKPKAPYQTRVPHNLEDLVAQAREIEEQDGDNPEMQAFIERAGKRRMELAELVVETLAANCPEDEELIIGAMAMTTILYRMGASIPSLEIPALLRVTAESIETAIAIEEAEGATKQ